MSAPSMAVRLGPPASVDTPVALPIIEQINDLETQKQPTHRVILFNDDDHSCDEVVFQIQKATGYSLEKAEAIMWQAHTTGQSVVFAGDVEACQRVAGILEQIGLRVSVEQ